MWLNQERFAEADEMLTQAINVDGQTPSAHCLKAQALEGLKQEEAARSHWKECLAGGRQILPEEAEWAAIARKSWRLRPMKAPRWLWYGIGWGTVALLWSATAQPAQGCRIIEIRGNGAAIERRGASGRGSASVGTILRVGDLVYPTNGATVRLQCRTPDNRFTHPSRTRVFGLADVCPDCVSTRYADGSRGEDDFLLFLEDRFEYASQVAEDSPTFRWDGVPGVTAYRVQVWDCGQAVFNCTELLWQETVEGREVTYSGAALEPGRNYELVVSPSTDPEQVLAYLTLRRLDIPQAEALQDSLAQVETVELGPEAAALARANQYLAVAEPDTLPPEGVVWYWMRSQNWKRWLAAALHPMCIDCWETCTCKRVYWLRRKEPMSRHWICQPKGEMGLAGLRPRWGWPILLRPR
jgi:hypothetical protein